MKRHLVRQVPLQAFCSLVDWRCALHSKRGVNAMAFSLLPEAAVKWYDNDKGLLSSFSVTVSRNQVMAFSLCVQVMAFSLCVLCTLLSHILFTCTSRVMTAKQQVCRHNANCNGIKLVLSYCMLHVFLRKEICLGSTDMSN